MAAMMAQQQNNDAPLPGEEAGLPFIGYTYKRLYVCSPLTITRDANEGTAMRLRGRADCKLLYRGIVESYGEAGGKGILITDLHIIYHTIHPVVAAVIFYIRCRIV